MAIGVIDPKQYPWGAPQPARLLWNIMRSETVISWSTLNVDEPYFAENIQAAFTLSNDPFESETIQSQTTSS